MLAARHEAGARAREADAGACQGRRPGEQGRGVLRRVEWTVLRRLDGLLHGDYRTLFRGYGLDLADLREYQYGDDVRHIDWNVTARLQTPYVREFHEDREITAWFLLDLSQSVELRLEPVSKRNVSTDFVAVLARLLTRRGNRVGALYYGEQVDGMIPARSGRRQVLNILHAMQAEPETPSSLGHQPGRAAARRRARRAPALAGLRRVGLHQRAGLGRGARPPGAAPRDHRRAAARPARGRAARPRPGGGAGRRDRRAAVRRHQRPRLPASASPPRRRGAKPSCAPRSARRGVDAIELSTNDDLVETVMRFADLKRRGRHSKRFPVPAG